MADDIDDLDEVDRSHLVHWLDQADAAIEEGDALAAVEALRELIGALVDDVTSR